ncbi:NIF family HAD-type phosphatase [Roseateles sp. BYS96W]|uniref:NIF family HAD-type phosphatase n=1 Tax=Pelomonas nitida TaxID=3299027 RepID=A0ABW7GCX0_9BURK
MTEQLDNPGVCVAGADSSIDVLYLGIGGVLHPRESMYRWTRGRASSEDGHEPYECIPLLTDLLNGWPGVRIVLTSIRPQEHRLPVILEALGPGLAPRVIGNTFEDLTSKARFGQLQRHVSDLDYVRMSNALVVEKHLAWLRPRAWVGVDAEARGWTDSELACNVVITPPLSGLIDAEAAAKLAGLLAHQFGPPIESLPTEWPGRRATPRADPYLARRFAAAARAKGSAVPRPRVLALGLEGTLFSMVGGALVGRPHLFSFLQSSVQLFERIVVFPEDHDQFRAVAKALARQGDVPAWFPQVDRIAWDGKAKNLERAGVFELREALLVEDKPGYVFPGQEEQWVGLNTFVGSQRDQELVRVYQLLESVVQPEPGRAEE